MYREQQMIRTRCPKCNKRLGIDDGAEGTIVGCPICKQKFRVPISETPRPGVTARSTPAAEEFPELEVVEEGDATPGPDLQEEVAELDVEVDADDGEKPEPKKSTLKKKKKKKKKDEDGAMAMRNIIVGAVAVLGGIGLAAAGATRTIPQGAIDQLGEQIWIAPLAFGILLALVGVFYIIKGLRG
jgi:ssDNA-binding Zn-finger/Zn-ribbon topoisomerase 1